MAATTTYSVYLQSQAWQAKRQLRLVKAKFKCEACGAKKALQVHHLTYARIFQEDVEDLMVLCELHHKAIEEMIEKGALTRTGNTQSLRDKTLHLIQPKKPQVQKPHIPGRPRKEINKEMREQMRSSLAFMQAMTTLNRTKFKFWVRENWGRNGRTVANAMMILDKKA